jgi:hypothetical protein
MSDEKIQKINKRVLATISPFYVDFDKSKKVPRVSSRSSRPYSVILCVVHPVGWDSTSYSVELFETEYINLKILRDRGVNAFNASLRPNAKTGYDDVILSGAEGFAKLEEDDESNAP